MAQARLSPSQQAVLDMLISIGGIATTWQIASNLTSLKVPVALNGTAQSIAALVRKGRVAECHTRGRRGSDRLWRVVTNEGKES